MAVIVANGAATAALGHGLAFAANAGLTKAIAIFAGPVGGALDALWGSLLIAGPAYRVTVPCVLQVASIRQTMLRKQQQVKPKRSGLFKVCGLIALIALLYFLAYIAVHYDPH
jgi:hypothetical protein